MFPFFLEVFSKCPTYLFMTSLLVPSAIGADKDIDFISIFQFIFFFSFVVFLLLSITLFTTSSFILFFSISSLFTNTFPVLFSDISLRTALLIISYVQFNKINIINEIIKVIIFKFFLV